MGYLSFNHSKGVNLHIKNASLIIIGWGGL